MITFVYLTAEETAEEIEAKRAAKLKQTGVPRRERCRNHREDREDKRTMHRLGVQHRNCRYDLVVVELVWDNSLWGFPLEIDACDDCGHDLTYCTCGGADEDTIFQYMAYSVYCQEMIFAGRVPESFERFVARGFLSQDDSDTDSTEGSDHTGLYGNSFEYRDPSNFHGEVHARFNGEY